MALGVFTALPAEPMDLAGNGALRFYKKLTMGYDTLREIKVDMDICRKSEYVYKNYI